MEERKKVLYSVEGRGNERRLCNLDGCNQFVFLGIGSLILAIDMV